MSGDTPGDPQQHRPHGRDQPGRPGEPQGPGEPAGRAGPADADPGSGPGEPLVVFAAGASTVALQCLLGLVALAVSALLTHRRLARPERA